MVLMEKIKSFGKNGLPLYENGFFSKASRNLGFSNLIVKMKFFSKNPTQQIINQIKNKNSFTYFLFKIKEQK